MKEKLGKILEKIVTAIVIIGIIAYFLFLYPITVTTNEHGEAKCKSIMGLTVKC